MIQAMQEKMWVIIDLSEDRLKFELQQTIAQLIQCLVKIDTLKRQREQEKPFFLVLLDEYPQYRSPTTHTSLLRIARGQNLGLTFLCQDLGIFTDPEYRAITNCATLVVLQCAEHDARDLAAELFLHDGSSYRDWESTKNFTSTDELKAYVGLLMQQERGQAIARVKPSKDAYFVDIPEAKKPNVNPQVERMFRQAVAEKWYFKPRKAKD